MPLQVGQVFAGYTVLRVLGVGGMGTVYLATHPRLPREDALKVLPAELTDDVEYRARFTREAELAASLSHPHIVGIQDRGEYDGQFWISMDYVAGTDAARLLDETRCDGMSLDEVSPIVTAVAHALDYAHHRGLLHRDVKPANILLSDPDGAGRRIYLADFGIARRMDDAAGLTETNMAVGTVAYAAPEQLKGDPIDGRADQYSLACTAFHLLTGSTPYPDTNPTVVVTQQVFAPPPTIGARRPDLAGLDLVFMKAMAKDPRSRYGTCSEFAAQLSRYLGGEQPATAAAACTATAPALPVAAPPRRRPGILIAALVGATLLTIAGVFAGIQFRHESAAPAAAPTSTTVSAAPTTPTVTATPGPLNGTYRADFAVTTDLDGNGKGPGPISINYGLLSVCRGAVCVATASKLDGDPGFASNLVFDQVAGRWVAVAFGSNECRDAGSEYWQVLTLQPGPEGVLAGEFSATSANTCRYKRAVTFTRTGDVDISAVADPATVPPRVASPAEALHGHYHAQRTYADGSPSAPKDQAVATACVRTGERCMSYFHSPTSEMPLVFVAGIWTQNEEAEYPCPRGGTLHLSVTARFPLPQPMQDPVAVLSGDGHQEQTGACSVNTDFTQTFTRTGD